MGFRYVGPGYKQRQARRENHMSSAINADLPTKTFNPEDASLLEVFFEHNQATPEVFLSIQEAADRRMGLGGFFSFSPWPSAIYDMPNSLCK